MPDWQLPTAHANCHCSSLLPETCYQKRIMLAVAEIFAVILIILLTLVGMEALSWFMHKYLFHGPLWFIHKTHHGHKNNWLELNDIFSVLFAALAMYLMWIGHNSLNHWFWIGTGISLYGIIYFIFHDWFIHNRLKSFKSSNSYLSGLNGRIRSIINHL